MVMFRKSPNRYFGQFLGGVQNTSNVTSERGFFPSGSWTYSSSSNVEIVSHDQIRITNISMNVLTHTGNDHFVRLNQEGVFTNILEITGTGQLNSGDLGSTVIALRGIEWCLSWDNLTKGVGVLTATMNIWGAVS